jgi:hypothetical protein
MSRDEERKEIEGALEGTEPERQEVRVSWRKLPYNL